jgi:hypothetical protein
MKPKIRLTSRMLDGTLRRACEMIPQKRRKLVVLGLCFLFVAVFSVMLWDSFHNQKLNKMPEIEHIKPLDLPQDSIIQKIKDAIHGQKQ